MRPRARERGKRRLVVIDGQNPRPLGEPQRERADAGKQVGDLGGAGASGKHEPRQRRFALGGRLQKRGRRQLHNRFADAQCRRARQRNQFAMARQPRQIVLGGDARQRASSAPAPAGPNRARRRRGRRPWR